MCSCYVINSACRRDEPAIVNIREALKHYRWCYGRPDRIERRESGVVVMDYGGFRVYLEEE